jgi:transposase
MTLTRRRVSPKVRSIRLECRILDQCSAGNRRRIARRRGTKRAIVAVGRSILIIVWHLLSDPTVHYQDLGPGFYDTRINAEHRKRNHIRQLEALGYKVTLEPAA